MIYTRRLFSNVQSPIAQRKTHGKAAVPPVAAGDSDGFTLDAVSILMDVVLATVSVSGEPAPCCTDAASTLGDAVIAVVSVGIDSACSISERTCVLVAMALAAVSVFSSSLFALPVMTWPVVPAFAVDVVVLDVVEMVPESGECVDVPFCARTPMSTR